MDNATNNDTFIDAFSTAVQSTGISFNPQHRRLRCAGHIINLSVKAFIFSVSIRQFQNIVREWYSPELPAIMEDWRLTGPLGKVHNFSIYIRKSAQRMQEFKKYSGRVLLPRDNDTRWNSWYRLLVAFIKHKPAVLYFYSSPAYERDHQKDLLDREDWEFLEKLCIFLQDFLLATKFTEYRDSSIWQVLPCTGYLLDRYKEELLAIQDNPRWTIYLNLRLSSLQKYFDLTALSLIYVAAVVLNPTMQWSYFETKWVAMPGAISAARTLVRNLWEQEYKQQPPNADTATTT